MELENEKERENKKERSNEVWMCEPTFACVWYLYKIMSVMIENSVRERIIIHIIYFNIWMYQMGERERESARQWELVADIPRRTKWVLGT